MGNGGVVVDLREGGGYSPARAPVAPMQSSAPGTLFDLNSNRSYPSIHASANPPFALDLLVVIGFERLFLSQLSNKLCAERLWRR